MLKDFLIQKLTQAIKTAAQNNKLGAITPCEEFSLNIETPKNLEFGDFAVNVSPLARSAKIAPPLIAAAICEYFDAEDIETNIVQGFINFKIGKSFLNKVLQEVLEKKSDYGKQTFGNGEKVILEYVSANPTGPFHIGHGRWAAMGSALSSVMKFCGFDVFQEFYINDAGVQIKNLTHSLFIRILQERGEDVQFPSSDEEIKNFYTGEYLAPVAKKFVSENEQTAKSMPTNFETLSTAEYETISNFAQSEMLASQKNLLEKFNVKFDNFFSETSLHKSGKVAAAIESLDEKGMLYEKDGAIWFKSSEFGDDQDRVIKKQDGYYTYLTADIAYHYNKIERGFEKLINIWGADHHGYVPRMRASIEALGYNPDMLEVLLGQLVNLVISGEQVRMGKRTKMLTLEELINEVGVDATRFWMIFRSIDTTLDFDVDLAKSNTDENPVFYVQYAHARASSILRNAVEKRFDTNQNKELEPIFSKKELENSSAHIEKLWQTDDEKAAEITKRLCLKLEEFNSIVYAAAKNRAPYLLCKYATDLAQVFHQFYSASRVLSSDKELSLARLSAVKATKTIISNTLNLLSVTAPERM